MTNEQQSPLGRECRQPNDQLADSLRTFAKTLADETAASLLHEAARRLTLQADPAYRVSSVRMVSKADPTQFDGVLEDGDAFFVRYRSRQITVYVDDHLIHFDEFPDAPVPDRITFAEAKRLLREVLEFPDSLKVGG